MFFPKKPLGSTPSTAPWGQGRASPERRLKGIFELWCSRNPQAVLTSSEMALAACSSFSRSPDDCMHTEEGGEQGTQLGKNSRNITWL